MNRQAEGLRNVSLRFVSKFLAKELRDARKRWGQGLRGKQAWQLILITTVSMYALWQWAFDQGFMFGLSFLIAAILAILRGHIFTHPFRLFLVAIAVVIGTLVIPGLRGDAWQALRQGDTLTAVGLVVVAIFFWQFKKQLETGQVGKNGPSVSKRRRRSRRR